MLLAPSLLALSLLGCSTPAPEVPPAAEAAPAAAPAAEPPPEAAPAASGVNLGADFAADSIVPVDTLVAAADQWSGKVVVTEAVVKEVCQAKGCWHTLATSDPAVAVMVKDKEYQVFLPKDAAGRKVHVKGTFALTEMPEDEARHYAEDAGRDPSTIVGAQKSYQIDVEGVRFLEG